MNVEFGMTGRTMMNGVSNKERRIRDGSWRPKSTALRLRVFVILWSLDMFSVLTGFTAASFVHGGPLAENNWVIIAILLPVYAVTSFNVKAYDPINLQERFRAIAKGAQALILAVCAVIFVAFCLKASATFPRVVVGLGFIAASGLIAGFRYIFVANMTQIVGGNPFSVILICDGEQLIPTGDFSVMIASAAFFDPDKHDPVMYDRLSKCLESADRVVVACGPERRVAWARALKGINIRSEIVVPELGAMAPLGVGSHKGMPTIVVANGPLNLFDRVVKRVFDIIVAGIVLVGVLPVLVVVAIAIKLDSRGPVLFRQTRIGRGNQMFEMLKFRSMRDDHSDGAGDRSTARDDDRITSVGNFIRKTSMDELPQLLNVLKGDMSLVGPRPHALGSRVADKLFWEIDERYWHRHAAKPGLTGLAQIRGYRGATLQESDLHNRLQADLEYLDTWSIWRDVKIILKTFHVLIHSNAF